VNLTIFGGLKENSGEIGISLQANKGKAKVR
jgi:hypothetical protein